jgi:hypothetical protein
MLILPEPYAQLAAVRQTVNKWDSELAGVDEIAGNAALLIISDLRSLIDDIPEVSDLELSDRLGQFLLPLLKDSVLSVTDIQEGHAIQRKLWGLEASERAAVTRMNDAEDAMARMMDKRTAIDAAAKYRGHKGNPESPCGGVGKCAICEALATQD